MTGSTAPGSAPTGGRWRGPCADDPDSWDLSCGDAASWADAMRTCRESCRFLAECLVLRTGVYPATAGSGAQNARTMPVGVIWAGTAYSDAGQVLNIAALRRLGAIIRNRRRRESGSPRPGMAGRRRVVA